MRITVEGYLTYKAALGRRVYDLADQPPPTLQDLLDLLLKEIPDQIPALDFFSFAGRERRTLALLLNGKHISHLPEGVNTKLKDGDLLSVFPPIVGG